MSFFSDVIDWGSKALFGSSGVDDLYDYAYDDPGIFEQAWDFAGDAYDWASEKAGDAYDWLQTPAGGLAGSAAKGFLGLDESGRPSRGNVDTSLKRSQARGKGASLSGGPSLASMGYTPRAIERGIQAKNSKNRYVQDSMRMLGVNLALEDSTVTLADARMPASNLTRKYQAKGITQNA